MGAMYNHQNAVLNYCDENDIVVQVDGDDWLPDSKTLSRINESELRHIQFSLQLSYKI